MKMKIEIIADINVSKTESFKYKGAFRAYAIDKWVKAICDIPTYPDGGVLGVNLYWPDDYEMYEFYLSKYSKQQIIDRLINRIKAETTNHILTSITKKIEGDKFVL